MKKIIFVISCLLCCIGVLFGLYASIIPNQYLAMIGGVYFFLLLLLLLLIRGKGIVSLIISIVIFIVLLAIVSCSSFLFMRADQFLTNISKTDKMISNYSVVVLKESTYQTLDDIKGLNMGVTAESNANYKKALNKLKGKVVTKNKIFGNSYELMNALLEKKIEVIFISNATISILEEGIEDLEERIRILDTIEIQEEEISFRRGKSEININKEAFSIYISGIDTYGQINTVSRSDVNIIATINPTTSRVLLTSVPRDMYVPLAGRSGMRDKLTHAGVYGIDTSVGTLENFLDVDIAYYVRINFNSLISLVDYIGGIDVESDYDFRSGNRNYHRGMNYNLSGEEALAFSRNRYAFRDGDRQRGRNQEKVIEAIIKKVTSSRDVNTYLNLLNTLEQSFQTNMSKDFMQGLIKKQIENNYQWQVDATDVNGYDHMDYTYSYPWQKLYVMLVDESSLASVKKKIKEVMS